MVLIILMYGLFEAAASLLDVLESLLRTPEYRERMAEKTHE